MTIAAARQAASAGNLANIDTPNYKAVEVSFAETLEAQVAADASAVTSAAAATPGVRTEEIRDAAARRDGNNVVLDQELLTMGRAAGDFSAAQTALAAKFRLVRYAINEGSYKPCPHCTLAISASASALSAERTRIEVAVSNMANAESTRSANGEPYRRRDVVLTSEPVNELRRRARPGLGAAASGSPTSSPIRASSAVATSRRILMPMPTASSRCPTSINRRRWSTCWARRAPIRRTSPPSA